MGRFHRHSDVANFAVGPALKGSHPREGDHVVRDVGDHSGYPTATLRIEVLENILGQNDVVASENRHQFEAAGVAALNLMSSPGAGKTFLLQRTLQHFAASLRLGIIEGDIETSLDADRLRGFGVPIALVNTSAGFGGECHLDARMVNSVLRQLPLTDLDLVIIENVGNLVCPAEFAVGETAKAMVYAITEGEDKPLKYPVMFRAVEVVVVNKMDLLDHLDFDLDLFLNNLRVVNPSARVVLVSARTGEGLDDWFAWVRYLAAK